MLILVFPCILVDIHDVLLKQKSIFTWESLIQQDAKTIFAIKYDVIHTVLSLNRFGFKSVLWVIHMIQCKEVYIYLCEIYIYVRCHKDNYFCFLGFINTWVSSNLDFCYWWITHLKVYLKRYPANSKEFFNHYESISCEPGISPDGEV